MISIYNNRFKGKKHSEETKKVNVFTRGKCVCPAEFWLGRSHLGKL